MGCDFQEETAIASGEGKLVAGWTAQWDAAENELPGVEGEVLLANLSLLADEVDGFQVFQPALRETDGRQRGLEPHRGGAVASLGRRDRGLGT